MSTDENVNGPSQKTEFRAIAGYSEQILSTRSARSSVGYSSNTVRAAFRRLSWPPCPNTFLIYGPAS